MRIVAIGALHGAFVHAMFKRHGELRANGRVAAVAEVALLLGFEEILGGGRTVNRMAVGTDNVVKGMFAATNVGSGNRLRMAA
jgi:hypothetical protein